MKSRQERGLNLKLYVYHSHVMGFDVLKFERLSMKGCNQMSNEKLKREINLFGGISILSGIMVGSGIFFIGSYVFLRTDFSIGLSLLAWLLGGVITLFYGLIYAELGTMMPEAGGYYIYLKKAYGKPVAFMSGFTNFILASSGSIAALALAFSLVLHNILITLTGVGIPGILQIVIAAGMIVVLSVFNFLNVRVSTNLLKVFLVLKAIPIAIVLASGLFFGTQSVDLSISLNGESIFSLLAMVGFAVIATFWAYEGWTNLNNVAGEIINPSRNLPLSLIISIAGITVLYVLYNYSIVNVLSLSEIQTMVANGEIYLGIPAAMAVMGSAGMYLVMVTMLISIFGALNAVIMAFPRVYYAMSKDGVLFEKFQTLHPKYKTPTYAIVGSSVMSLILLVFGLDDLISLIAFGALVFNTLIFVGLILFRKRQPDAVRPYKVWFYPYLPIITIIITIGLLMAMFVESIVPSLIGTAIILAALPIYYLIERYKLKS